jgi:hypothetical protein
LDGPDAAPDEVGGDLPNGEAALLRPAPVLTSNREAGRFPLEHYTFA